MNDTMLCTSTSTVVALSRYIRLSTASGFATLTASRHDDNVIDMYNVINIDMYNVMYNVMYGVLLLMATGVRCGGALPGRLAGFVEA